MFWPSEAAAEHSRADFLAQRGRCGTHRRLGSLLNANSVEQAVRCVCEGGAARSGSVVRRPRRQRTAGRRYGGTAVTEGRGDGGLNGKGGAARRKERHGKERRHDGRPQQRTAEHWAAGQTASA